MLSKELHYEVFTPMVLQQYTVHRSRPANPFFPLCDKHQFHRFRFSKEGTALFKQHKPKTEAPKPHPDTYPGC